MSSPLTRKGIRRWSALSRFTKTLPDARWIGSTAIAYLIYFRLIADVGPQRALTVTFLIPLFGVLWGALFLREPLTASMLAGGALIVGGVWLALRR